MAISPQPNYYRFCKKISNSLEENVFTKVQTGLRPTSFYISIDDYYIYDQACQNDSRFEISSDCVVIASQFHLAKSADNDNIIRVNLKMGVILTGLFMIH